MAILRRLSDGQDEGAAGSTAIAANIAEFPLGVLTVTLAVPGAEIRAVVIVTCNCWLLMTVVLSVVPLMTTTEDETNWLPFTVRRKPCCTSAKVIVVAERDPITGAGRALPHKGLSALQPGKNSEASETHLAVARIADSFHSCIVYRAASEGAQKEKPILLTSVAMQESEAALMPDQLTSVSPQPF